MSRHELRKDVTLGAHIIRCVECQQQWDVSKMLPGDAGALQFQECPGVPQVVQGGNQDVMAMTDSGVVPIPADLMSFEGFKPERGDSPDDYEGAPWTQAAQAADHMANPPYVIVGKNWRSVKLDLNTGAVNYSDPDYVPPVVDRKAERRARIRELFAELGELLADDGSEDR